MNNYKKYKGFWYKTQKEDNLWRVSRKENDEDCDVWIFNKKFWKLNEAIAKIMQDDIFEKTYEKVGD